MEVWAPWPQTNDQSYEAEDGYLNDANIRESSTASGGSYVGQIDDDRAFVEFTGVWMETPGQYNVQVYYANGGSVATMNVRVNNIHMSSAIFPPTGFWGRFSQDNYITISVPLLRGNNVLIFQHGTNFVELDKIVVGSNEEISSTTTTTTQTTMTPTPNSSQRVGLSFQVLLNLLAIVVMVTRLLQ